MVLRRGEQEPAGGEGLQQVEQFIGSHHGEALQVGRHCHREEKLKSCRLMRMSLEKKKKADIMTEQPGGGATST